MLWTDDAIESLRKMALEGMSASLIAAALGAESRNAVIGKANRMGIRLQGGGRASAPGRSNGGSPSPARRPGAAGEASSPRLLERRRAWIFADAEVGEMRRVRLEDIRGASCRWPIGDPGAGDFAYCGLTPADGRSYCAGHCRIAYRAPGDRGTRAASGGRNGGGSWRPA